MDNNIIFFQFITAMLFFLSNIFVFIVFGLFVWFGIKIMIKTNKNIEENGIETMAIIISSQYCHKRRHRLDHRHYHYHTRVMYVGVDTKEHFVVLNTSEEMPIGAKIKIKYLPTYPRIVKFCGFIEY